MNKKGMILTVSAFLIMLGFVALFSIIQTQQNQVFTEMSELSALDAMTNVYTSVENAVNRISNSSWTADITGSGTDDIVEVYLRTPFEDPKTEAQRFTNFVNEKSRFEINHSFDFDELLIEPHEITISQGTNSMTTTPKNTNSSVKKIKGYSIRINWDGSTDTIKSSLSTASDGINFTVYLYATKGQTLRKLETTIDPYKNSTINLELYPTLNTSTGKRTVNITVDSPAEMEISYESGTTIDIHEKILLEHNNSLQVKYKKAELLVNNTEFDISRQGEVSI